MEKIRSLLEDIKLEEGGSGDEEMTEERVNAILDQVRQAEKDMCSVPGWQSDKTATSSPAATEAPKPQDGSPGSRDKTTAQKKTCDEEQAGASTSKKKHHHTQHNNQGAARDNTSSSDEETTVTTKVYRRRVILKGEQARNIPGESVTEEQFIDDDGHLVTRKGRKKEKGQS